jgi:DRTGG domain
MNINDLANHINARIHASTGTASTDLHAIFAADTMSELIAHAEPGTLLVTSLNNNQLVRVAELMDVPGICLTGGAEPSVDLIARAEAAGTTILVSPFGYSKTLRLLEDALAGGAAAKR